MKMHRALRHACFVAAASGCSTAVTPSGNPRPDLGTPPPAPAVGAVESGAADAGLDAAEAKAAKCTGTFGKALTAGFGRADGVVLAVVTPADQQCPRPNRDHVVVEITMNGLGYRMVVAVESDFGPDYRMRFAALDHALPAPEWSEGWHTGVTLDYPTTLGAGNGAFAPIPMAELVGKISDAIAIGDHVSFYTWTSGGDSAHKVHRNAEPRADGAIVLGAATSNPRWLLFHFAGQAF
jgi:hypothetical protein